MFNFLSIKSVLSCETISDLIIHRSVDTMVNLIAILNKNKRDKIEWIVPMVFACYIYFIPEFQICLFFA